MAKVTGVVGWVGKNKFDKYSIKLEDNPQWYNSNYPINCEKGDTVEFDDGDKNYCRKLRVVSSGGGASAPSAGGKTGGGSNKGSFPIGVRDGQRSIIRQNALTNARELVTNVQDPDEPLDNVTDEIIRVARKFEAYTTGDMDMEEVSKKMGGFNPED